MSKALIIVDVQNDFVTGSLAVPGAKEIIPVIHWIVANTKYDTIVETFDWHPEGHISFKQWPIHCVQGSVGAESALTKLIFPSLPIRKGTDINIDSYSAFFDNDHKWGTGLEAKLREVGNIQDLDIVGIATDYCVKFTALDAIKLGYRVNVLSFACRGVTPETTQAAIEEMKNAGVNIL